MRGSELAALAARSAELAAAAADIARRVRGASAPYDELVAVSGIVGAAIIKIKDWLGGDSTKAAALDAYGRAFTSVAERAYAYGAEEAPAPLLGEYQTLLRQYQAVIGGLAQISGEEVAAWRESGIGPAAQAATETGQRLLGGATNLAKHIPNPFSWLAWLLKWGPWILGGATVVVGAIMIYRWRTHP